MASVSFSRRDEGWVVCGRPRPQGDEGELTLFPEDLPLVKVLHLRDALAAMVDYYGGTGTAHVSEEPAKYFNDYTPYSSVSFELVGTQVMLKIFCFVPWPESGNATQVVEAVTRLITPLLQRRRARVEDVSSFGQRSSEPGVLIELLMWAPWHGRTAADLFRLGQDVVALCDASAGGQVTRESVGDLVRGGSAHLLIGHEEGNWLDAKSEEYDLSGTAGQIRLAQAVARFANAEDGGLIVIGAKAKKIPGGEEIRKVDGVSPRQKDTPARYLRVLSERLYPPPYGLRVDLVPTRDSLALIVVDVPSQREELKPFLVHGAITAEGDVEGVFISIVQRRGEGSIPITAPMIHASIAAGRALLRRGYGEK